MLSPRRGLRAIVAATLVARRTSAPQSPIQLPARLKARIGGSFSVFSIRFLAHTVLDVVIEDEIKFLIREPIVLC